MEHGASYKLLFSHARMVEEALGRSDVGSHPRVDALEGLPTRKSLLPAIRENIRDFVVTTLTARGKAAAAT